MPQLVVEKGNDRNATITLAEGDKVVVGRDIKASFRLHDVMTSRKHFLVVGHQGNFFLKDLGSANGTFLNGQRITDDKPHKLGIGDKIQIGETILSFLDESEGAKKGGLIGKEIAGYRIEERLGRGSMGTVYKATQLSLDRLVALKILAPELLKDQSFIEMFIKEARACGALNHPNIIQVYDVGNFKGIYYFSMEFAGAGSVQDRIANNTFLPLEKALPMMIDACEALVYAERKKIVHRDIKPDNMFLNDDGVIKIGDLGLAHSTAESEKQDGVYGTPHYIAPEQAMNQQIDHRADIYALGGTFYRMITGYTPYRGANVQEILRKQVKEPPPYAVERPSDLGEDVSWPTVPPFVADVIYKMMAKNPAERYSSANEIVPELQQAIQQLPAAQSAGMSRRHAGYSPNISGGQRAISASGVGAVPGASGTAPTKKFDFGNRFNELDPKKKLLVMIGGGIGSLVLIVALVAAFFAIIDSAGTPDPVANNTTGGPSTTIVLTGRNTANNSGGNPSNTTTNTGGNAAENNPTPPPVNNAGEGDTEGQRKRREREKLIGEIHDKVIALMTDADLVHKVPADLKAVDDAVAALRALHDEYKTHELLRDEDGEVASTEAADVANRLEAIRNKLAPLHASYQDDYRAVQQVVAEATPNKNFGRIFQAYIDYSRKYYTRGLAGEANYNPLGDSGEIRELRDFLERLLPDVDDVVEGFPPAVEICDLARGKVWALHKQLVDDFTAGMAAMDAATAREPALPTYDARRQELAPHREFFNDVLTVWKLPDYLQFEKDEPGQRGRTFNVEARLRFQTIMQRLSAIDAEEASFQSDAISRLRLELRGILTTAANDAQRLDFDAARQRLDDLRNGETYKTAERTGDPRVVEYGQIIDLKLNQVRHAERFIVGLLNELKSKKIEISKPEALSDAAFDRARTVEVVGATASDLQITRRGSSPFDFPWASLSPEEFFQLASKVYDLANLRDIDKRLGLGIVLLELGDPTHAPDVLQPAYDQATGQQKRDVKEYLAFALVMRAQQLLQNGEGQAAKQILNRFRQEFADTRAAQMLAKPPAERFR